MTPFDSRMVQRDGPACLDATELLPHLAGGIAVVGLATDRSTPNLAPGLRKSSPDLLRCGRIDSRVSGLARSEIPSLSDLCGI
jgi:hypothetical protein